MSVSVSHIIQQQSTLRGFSRNVGKLHKLLRMVKAKFLYFFEKSGPAFACCSLSSLLPICLETQQQVSETPDETSAVDGLHLIPSLKAATRRKHRFPRLQHFLFATIPPNTIAEKVKKCGYIYNSSDMPRRRGLYFRSPTRNCSLKRANKDDISLQKVPHSKRLCAKNYPTEKLWVCPAPVVGQ